MLERQCRTLTLLTALSLMLTQLSAVAEDFEYKVENGDNLWDLSEKYLKSMRYWRRLQAYNNLAQPRAIPPGSTLRIPVAWLKTELASVLVVSVRGEVKALRAGASQPESLAPGQTLAVGDEVRSGPEANATLQFEDGSELLLQSSSRLMIERSTMYGPSGMLDARMRLPEGRSENKVAPAKGPASRFEITTPSAVIAVRGTEYRVGMDAQQDVARTEVLAQRVQVAASGQSTEVPEGFGSVTRTGEPPSAPVELLSPPDLRPLPDVFDRIPISISFPALSGAVAYRVQIAPTPTFHTLLLDRTTSAPGLSGPDLADGSYYLRVRGIDGQGLEGRNAERLLRVDARPVPPFSITPAPDAVIDQDWPELKWSKPEGAVSYRVQLAEDADFNKLIVERRRVMTDGLSAGESLEPGVYYWRVATVDASGEQGPFGDPQAFRRAPPGPAIDAPSLDENEVTLRWRSGLPGQRYHVQVSADSAFNQPLLDSQLEAPELTMPRPDKGTYYVRVSVIDVDGYEGRYGEAQSFEVAGRSKWPLLLLPLIGLLL